MQLKHTQHTYRAHIAKVHGKKHSRVKQRRRRSRAKSIMLVFVQMLRCIAQAHCIRFSALALKNRSLCIAFNIKIQNDKEHNFLHTFVHFIVIIVLLQPQQQQPAITITEEPTMAAAAASESAAAAITTNTKTNLF